MDAFGLVWALSALGAVVVPAVLVLLVVLFVRGRPTPAPVVTVAGRRDDRPGR